MGVTREGVTGMERPRKTEILRVLVGSRAHGLERPDSDWDYSGVYVTPTEEVLSLGFQYKGSRFLEGTADGADREDNVAYEIGHFLHLSTKCNPTILSVYLAPIVSTTEWGHKLRALFPAVWNSKGAFDAFVGYAANQRKKLLEKKDNRPRKYAAAYIRTLYNLCELLQTGTFNVRTADTPIASMVRRLKDGVFTFGEVVDEAERLTEIARDLLTSQVAKEADLAAVNRFLLDVRKAYWT